MNNSKGNKRTTEKRRGAAAPINRNTKRHGRAAASALLRGLEDLSKNQHGEHYITRAIAGIIGEPQHAVAQKIGAPELPEETYEIASMKLFRAYLDGYATAPKRARKGFADVLGDYVTVAADGSVMDAKSYDLGVSAPERTKHARLWLKAENAAPR